MKIWITKNSDVPVRTQIVSQVRVGIASGDLQPGDRLPSTREIARRFGVHANTVSAAYRELAAAGAVDLRKGSGIYVCENGRDALDALIDGLFRKAERAGFAREEVLERIGSSRNGDSADAIGLYEPNSELAEILRFEIREATGLKVMMVADRSEVPPHCPLVAMFDERQRVTEKFENTNCLFLTTTSVAGAMAGRPRPGKEDLVALVSGWDDFLRFARLYLLAVGLDAAAIVTVSKRVDDWKRRIDSATMIICDRSTAAGLSNDERVVAFPVISAGSIEELKRMTDRPANVSLI